MSLLKVTRVMPQSGSLLSISGSSPTSLSASLNISASAFYGDGSNLTGVTADWDGSHNGDGEITGSLIVTQDLTLGTSTSHTLALYSGLMTIPGAEKLDVDGAIDGLHSTPQSLSRDMKLPDAHNGILIGPTVSVPVGKTITVGTGSILQVINPGLL